MSLSALFYPKVSFDTLFIPYIYKEIYFDGIYVDICNQKKDMITLDVGANIGIVTQYLRDYSKKVYAIEPAEEHFEALEMNKKYNKWDNVEVFKYAIDDVDGETTLHHSTGNRTCHSLAKDFGQGGEKVRTIRLDTFFKENNIESVDFMKFDVEFAEDLILHGSGFKNVMAKIKAIMVEFHAPNWRDTVKYMMELGFQARQYTSSAIIILFTH